ncbi:hypothetical protein RA210_U50185 [Rubrivivax sp. A210]|nr:hypothetical protein RA210_U50185 [Rubrivivax sp. A210]
MGYGICAWMLIVLWGMFQQSGVETSFVVVYLVGTLLVAAWSTRQVLLDLKEDSAVVAAATQGLRPRRVKAESSTNKAESQSR